MMAWLKVELVCIFMGIQFEAVRCARVGSGTLSPVFGLLVQVVIFGTVGWSLVAMVRAGRNPAS